MDIHILTFVAKNISSHPFDVVSSGKSTLHYMLIVPIFVLKISYFICVDWSATQLINSPDLIHFELIDKAIEIRIVIILTITMIITTLIIMRHTFSCWIISWCECISLHTDNVSVALWSFRKKLWVLHFAEQNEWAGTREIDSSFFTHLQVNEH